MNNIKHNVIKTIYAGILESIEYQTIIGGMNGSCNLYADYLNDFSGDAINRSVAEFLQDNVSKLDIDDIECILESPDYIIQAASTEFYNALLSLFDGNTDTANKVLNHSDVHFDSWGNYYVFANPWSNTCVSWFIIRADNEADAYEWLTTKFESKFLMHEDDVSDVPEEDVQRNDNGNPINTDNLQLIGSFSFTK